LTEAAVEEVRVPYRILSGTAIQDSDWAASSDPLVGVLVFAPGVTQRSLSVRSIRDNVAEPDESVVLEVGAPTGARLPGAASALQASG
jgi:chitinase